MMKTVKSLVLAGVLAMGGMGSVSAAAPAAPVVAVPAVPAPVVAAPVVATPAAAPAVVADAAAEAPKGSYTPMKPTAGVGQPVNGGMDFQPQVTEIGERGKWLNNVILLPLMTAVTLFVLGLMFWVVVRYRAKANPVPSKTSHNTLIEVIWTLVPVLILVGIAIPSISLLAAQYKPASKDAITIKVTGYQWNWGYAYPDQEIPEYLSKMLDKDAAAASGEPFQLAVDNRMVVPVGRQVKLLITGADVIHSFAVPALWTKMDAVPGRSNETTFTVTKPGVYYGQCSELCGVDHGFMPIAVEALPEAQFNEWVRFKGGKLPGDSPPAAAATPAAAPATAPAVAPAAPAAVTK